MKMLNRTTFYERIKTSLFGGKLTAEQIDVIEAILNQCDAQNVTDNRQVAYCLATCYHECYNWNQGHKGRMVQLEEMGGEKYLKSQKYYPFYGRGPSHLTWEHNYKKEGKRIGLDLITHPGMMLDLNIGSESHVYNMRTGGYCNRKLPTGGYEPIKLSDYINSSKCDFRSARRIINGLDQAELVAGYAQSFYRAMV